MTRFEPPAMRLTVIVYCRVDVFSALVMLLMAIDWPQLRSCPISKELLVYPRT